MVNNAILPAKKIWLFVCQLASKIFRVNRSVTESIQHVLLLVHVAKIVLGKAIFQFSVTGHRKRWNF